MSALVRMSRTFPSTTACTDTIGDVPTPEAERSLSSSRSVTSTDTGLVPAITQTPTSVGLSKTAGAAIGEHVPARGRLQERLGTRRDQRRVDPHGHAVGDGAHR